MYPAVFCEKLFGIVSIVYNFRRSRHNWSRVSYRLSLTSYGSMKLYKGKLDIIHKTNILIGFSGSLPSLYYTIELQGDADELPCMGVYIHLLFRSYLNQLTAHAKQRGLKLKISQ